MLSIRTLLVAALLGVLCRSVARAQTMDWVATLDGPDAGHDFATALATDAAGNLFVCGTTEFAATGLDWTLAKFDSSGNLLFTTHWSAPGGGNDFAYALQLDGQGNVIVGGDVVGAGGTADIGLAKFDPEGNLLWAHTYDGPGHGADGMEWTYLRVDSAGNVVQSGFSYGGATGYDAVVLKYAPDGTLLWERRIDGGGSGFESAWAVRIGSDDSVFVAGDLSGPLGSGLLLARYAPDGTLLWQGNHAFPSSQFVTTYAMALNHQDEPVVAALVYSSATADDYGVAQFDAAGQPVWFATYDGGAGREELPWNIAVGPSDEVYVVGMSEGFFNMEYATLRYDGSGNLVWAQRYAAPGGYWGGDTVGSDLAVDCSGNVFVTGWSYNGPPSGFDGATLMYSPDGVLEEEWRYDSATHGNDYLHAILVDSKDRVFAVGQSMGSGFTLDWLVIEYDRPGMQLEIQPATPAAGDPLSLRTSPGKAGTTAMLVITEVNNTPLFTRVLLGPFDSKCTWNLNTTTPAGLGGLDITFQTFGFNKSGKLVGSNPSLVQFQ